MTDIENKEIRGITWKIAIIVLGGVGTICSTFIWGVSRMETVMQLHEYRIKEVESKMEKMERYMYPKNLASAEKK